MNAPRRGRARRGGTLRRALFLAAAVCAFAPASCGRFKQGFPAIDAAADSVSMRYGVLWAVVSDTYAAYRAGASLDASVVGHGRLGDVEQVTARAFERTESGGEPSSRLWYGFDKGWLPESSVQVFGNKYRAQNAARALLPPQ